MTIAIILFGLASYLLGSIPTGLMLGKLFSGRDIRSAGSGNIGATNVSRVLGKRLGILTLAGDVLKGWLPMMLGTRIFAGRLTADALDLCLCLFGLAALLGHLFSAYLKFKGGKGVATALGIFIYLEPVGLGLAAVLFIAVAALWRYVSLGSLAAAAALPVILFLLSFVRPVSAPVILLSLVAGVLIFIKHRPNIQRLLQGTEHRIGAQAKQ
jgi:glycerol-3-phosphate acyltransferase PlsY